MSSTQEPLSKYLPARLSEARLARQYGEIAARARPGAWSRGRAWGPMGLTFAAMAAVLVIFLARRSPTVSLADGTVLESTSAVSLNDGSRVAVGPASRVRLKSTRADAIRLELERGRVDVAATHREGRSFVVSANGYEVQVVGTRFVVEILPDERVDVRVDEGRVQVRAPNGEVRAVSAGESWSTASDATAKPDANVDGASSGAPDPAAADAPDTDDEDGDVDARAVPRSKRTRRAASAGSGSAKELLDDAQRATAEGRMGDAARLFDSIRHDHRRDPRAALAAFELGRIRMDSLGDPAGAEEALRDAIRLARGGPLREDAEARRVEALDKMGSPACSKAKDDYLSRYPAGVHRAAVSGRCAPR